MTFSEKLSVSIDNNNSLLCVGLDSDVAKLPVGLRGTPDAQLVFNKAIVDATADLVCAYKPNTAFYEAQGDDGLRQLHDTIAYINQEHPKIPVLLDAKRADIGNTNQGYINFAFTYLGADAITLHPYLGRGALQPFLDLKDKGIIILARTSNDGSGEFQDLEADGQPLYQRVAQNISKIWNTNNNCLLVVGATYPAEMKAIRQTVGPDMVFLVPGIGAQGGDLQAVMENGLGANKDELIINSSRGIIFASDGDDYAEVARQEATKLRDEINKYRS